MSEIVAVNDLPDIIFMDDQQRGCIHIMSQKAGFSLPPHNHYFYHINFVLWGSVEIRVANQTLSARAGSVFVLPPGIPHSLYSPLGYGQIGLDVVKADAGIFRLAAETFRKCPAIFHLEYLVNEFKNLGIDLVDLTHIEKLSLFNFVDRIILNIVSKQINPNRSDFRTTLQTLFKKEDVYSLSVDDICRHLFISKTHLERLMKKTYGCGVKGYINSRKLADIHYYLIETDLSVGEIAKRLRFYDSAHLITFFKRHTGSTPAAFRKNLNNRKGEKQ